MESFDSILHRAVERKGGRAAVDALLPAARSGSDLAALPDRAYLAEMTKCVFRSGFVWKVIENKWPGFEAAFRGFDVAGCAMLSDEDIEQFSADERIVRHAAKIRSVPANAAFILDVRREAGGFGRYLADWPEDEIVGLWEELKRRGSRLGGQTGRYFLRFVGKDTPILSRDVVKALIGQGVIDREPTSKKALARVQDAFNEWRAESGRELCQISRVLSLSVD
jgi:3-methyladenine DNA glycosylase Tag